MSRSSRGLGKPSGGTFLSVSGRRPLINTRRARQESDAHGKRRESPRYHVEGETDAETQTRQQQPGGLGHRARLHGDELRLRPGHGQAGGRRADPAGRRTRRHVLRHRRGLRPVHERGARGRGPRPVPRPGGDRHEVRVRHRPRDGAARRRPEQPARAHQGGRRGVAQAAEDRAASTCSISTASTRTCRSRTWPGRSRS